MLAFSHTGLPVNFFAHVWLPLLFAPTATAYSQPDANLVKARPSVFCFALANSEREVSLLEVQQQAAVGIFACDEWVVYSNRSLPTLSARTLGGLTLDVPRGGRYESLLNSEAFQAIWRDIFWQRRYRSHDWTVKVDPDTALSVPHLRHMLREIGEASQPVFLLNGLGVLWGAIEVLSLGAMHAFADGSASCESSIDISGKGEDWYLHLCMEHLGLQGVVAARLLSLRPWHQGPCNGSEAAFHPFKSRGALLACLRRVETFGSFSRS
eukprot:TRINITY_DN70934_c0_g1_i1.p1 TRINITY_DN70934_c0_g1~~TRINITY_DN70934_c0_g1_i1.p1  ORF type:complete len:267 (+),score=19.91 TRINITY_DN70934_c0_g1_i1:215-1015(+)